MNRLSNIRGFLDMIAWSELGPRILASTDNGYNVCVGSTPTKLILFDNYDFHPRIRNEALNSDAAGRYQFMGRYWEAYRESLYLPNFGKDAQDKWAMQLVRECKAYDDVCAGRIADAIYKCRSRWASFPGAGYKQRENKLADLLAAYQRAGGELAK